MSVGKCLVARRTCFCALYERLFRQTQLSIAYPFQDEFRLRRSRRRFDDSFCIFQVYDAYPEAVSLNFPKGF